MVFMTEGESNTKFFSGFSMQGWYGAGTRQTGIDQHGNFSFGPFRSLINRGHLRNSMVDSLSRA
jgi:hypothetical protein